MNDKKTIESLANTLISQYGDDAETVAMLRAAEHAAEYNEDEWINGLQDEKDNFFKTIDEDKQPEKFKSYRYQNEEDAWDKGLRFANSFGIKVNIQDWMKVKRESLQTYL